MKKVILLIFVCVLLSPSPVFSKESKFAERIQTARENARKVVQKTRDVGKKAKENWDEREHVCPECGKKTHLKGLCASCKAKAARERASQVAKKTKETYDEGKKIAKNVAKKSRESFDKISEKTVQIYQKASPEIVAGFNRARDKARKVKQAIDKNYPLVKAQFGKSLDKILDPETRREAMEAVCVAYDVANRVAEFRRQAREFEKGQTYQNLERLANLPLIYGGQKMTLGEFAGDWLVEKFPEIEETDIAENPAACVAALTCLDREYLLEAKLIKRGDECVSAQEAVMGSFALDSGSIMKGLDVMAAAEKFHESVLDEDPVGAIDNFVGVLEKAGE